MRKPSGTGAKLYGARRFNGMYTVFGGKEILTPKTEESKD
jgi:hypothetical protein